MRNLKSIFLLITLITSGFIISTNTIRADMGPKPSVNIYIYENGLVNTIPPIKITMLGCDREFDTKTFQYVGDCQWKESSLYWFRGCSGGKCLFTYMLPDKFKIAYQANILSKVIVSNEIDRVGMNDTYKLYVMGDKATIEHVSVLSGFATGSFLLSFILNLLIESGVLYLFIKLFKFRGKLFWALIIGNLITLPVVWAGTLLLQLNFLALEVFAVLAEYTVYRFWARNQQLSNLKLFILSFVQNIVSLSVGGLISFILSFI